MKLSRYSQSMVFLSIWKIILMFSTLKVDNGLLRTSENADASLLEYAREKGKKVLDYQSGDDKEVFDNYKLFYDQL